MKVFTSIKNVEHFDNRSKVTFNVSGNHNDYVSILNQISIIERKHNAQSMIYKNRNSLIFDKNGKVKGLKNGDSGGTITFHSHSCNPKKATKELVELLESVN